MLFLDTLYFCRICSFDTGSLQNWSSHISNDRHLDREFFNSLKKGNNPEAQFVRSNSFICTLCSARKSGLKTWKEHLNTQHNMTVIPDSLEREVIKHAENIKNRKRGSFNINSQLTNHEERKDGEFKSNRIVASKSVYHH